MGIKQTFRLILTAVASEDRHSDKSRNVLYVIVLVLGVQTGFLSMIHKCMTEF
jgi:hypothetical protein